MKKIISILLIFTLLIGLPIQITAATQSTTMIFKLKIHFIDVGQADCILIQTPSNKVMLIDAGNNEDSDTILSYIKSLKISKIDVLVGTHPHEDHIGSMDSVIKTFSIGKIYMPKVSSNTKTYEDVLSAIKAKALKITTATAGLKITLDSNLTIQMLSPNSAKYDDLNNYSPVIKLVYGSTSFLFTGDAETVSEKEILSKKYNVKADVLKVGHHGSNSSTSSTFLKAVSPKYAVISVGKDNDYGHPTAATLTKLSKANIQIFRTDLLSTIIATSDGKAISFDNTNKPSAIEFKYGGTNVVLKLKEAKGIRINYNDAFLNGEKEILTKRVTGSAISNAQFIVNGKDKLIDIKIPYTENQHFLDIKPLLQSISQPGVFSIQEVDENSKDKSGNYLPTGRIVISNYDIEDANTTTSGILLKLTSAGRIKFADATKRNIGKPLGVFIDSTLFQAPMVEAEITNPTVLIAINDKNSKDQLICLANIIKNKSLATGFDIIKIEAYPAAK